MSTLYDIEQWRQHHKELLQEAEERRMALRLPPAQPRRGLRIKKPPMAGVHLLFPRRTAE